MTRCARSAFRLLAALLALAGCGETTPPTQLVVAVNASPMLTATLKSLRFDLFPLDATNLDAPARSVPVPLGVDDGAGRIKQLPLSVGVLRHEVDDMLLVVHGCDDGPECRNSRVSQALRIRFEARQTAQIDVLLTDACIDASMRCVAPPQTCAAQTGPAGAAGACVPVAVAASRVVVPGQERFPSVPVWSDASRSCPVQNTCAADTYPCERDQGQGYVCRGQLADWPMPDSTKPSGPPQYDLSVAGVVRDPVTGLSWQRQTPESYTGCSGTTTRPGDTCTFEEALDYCSQLDLDGRGWRVPSKIELESLFDPRLTVRSLAPDVFFLVDSAKWYWTISPVTGQTHKRWVVWFGPNLNNMLEETSSNSLRCVRSPQAPLAAVSERYVNRGEGFIGDARTGLLWDARILCEPDLSYASAESFCASSPVPLRVPTQKELLTLVDPTRSSPAVSPVFTTTPARGFLWSSTTAKPAFSVSPLTTAERLVLEFGTGASLADDYARAIVKETSPAPYCVRCVQ